MRRTKSVLYLRVTASKILMTAFLLALVVCTPINARATTIYLNTTPTGHLSSPGSATDSFSATAGLASLFFNLVGYDSLDGDHFWWEDDFTLKVNGATLIQATFNLGGDGNTVVFYNPNGATFSGDAYGVWLGGSMDILLPISLINGTNTIEFIYDSPIGANFSGSGGHAGPQGLLDE